MKLYFLNINSIGITPLMSYIVKYLSENYTSSIVESYIGSSNNFHYIKNKKYIKKYKDSYSFNKQTLFNKMYKYVYILFFLLKLSFKKKLTKIYSVDFQVISFALILKRIFNKRNWKIVYHQFELIDIKSLGKENLFFFNKMKKNARYIDLIIVPEKNRLDILLKQLKISKEKSFYFPNINAIDTFSEEKHKILKQLPKNAKIVGHIGSIGTDHYIYSFIEAAKKIEKSNIFFLFVGKQNNDVKQLANNISLKNIIFIDEVPHSDLKNIYSFLDLGFILYKGIDDNFEYCAPNKLYEYWAYGVPVIAHKLKGLKHEFKYSPAGKLINLDNVDEIVENIQEYINWDNRVDICNFYQTNYNLQFFLNNLLIKLNSI